MKKIQQGLRLAAASMLAGTTLLGSAGANACSDDSYAGTICATAGRYCPSGYVPAEGQILSVAQNQLLYAVLGNQYGGDGYSTFQLPDLRGRSVVGSGQGPGLSQVSEGQRRGDEQMQLSVYNLPAHTHSLNAMPVQGDTTLDAGAWLSDPSGMRGPISAYASANTAGAPLSLNAQSISSTGMGHAFPTLPPQLGLLYCISVGGPFPPHPN